MAFFDFATISPKSKIGDIEIAVSLQEVYLDTLQITEHPVERGAAITDHSFKRPCELTLQCGWSNGGFDQLSQTVSAFFKGGEISTDTYVASVYSKLLALQEKREPFDVITGMRKYTDMLLVSLGVTRDQQTAGILMVNATLKQVVIVNTKATTLPDKDAQASPEDTQPVENQGNKTVTSGDPSQGGSIAVA